jgi:hypothetical protein
MSIPGMWIVSRLMEMPFQPARMAPLGLLHIFWRFSHEYLLMMQKTHMLGEEI